MDAPPPPSAPTRPDSLGSRTTSYDSKAASSTSNSNSQDANRHQHDGTGPTVDESGLPPVLVPVYVFPGGFGSVGLAPFVMAEGAGGGLDVGVTGDRALSPNKKTRFLLPQVTVKAVDRDVDGGDGDNEEGVEEEHVTCRTALLLPRPVPYESGTRQATGSNWRWGGPGRSRCKVRGIYGPRGRGRGRGRSREDDGIVGIGNTLTVGLWLVLFLLGGMFFFVFMLNEETEGPPPGGENSVVLNRLNAVGQARTTFKRWTESPRLFLSPPPPPPPSPLPNTTTTILSSKWGIPYLSRGLYTQDQVSSSILGTDGEQLVEAKHGAVSSDVEQCSKIGVELLKLGGNAVDAVIGTGACIGTVNMYASGIGGGGFATVRLRDGHSASVNFREMAPAASHRDMFNKDPLSAQVGGLAFAIPGEVHGYWTLHQKYGKLPWKTVWEPAIKMNRDGFYVTEMLAKLIKKQETHFLENIDEWAFLASEEKGRLLNEGEIMKRPALARTLELITGTNGLEKFYNGSIAESLVDCAQRAGGIITKEDFAKFFTIMEPTISTHAFGREFVTCQAPCSGPVLLEGINIAAGLNMADSSNPNTIHRLVETMKWLSAGRTELGDPSDFEVDNTARVNEIMTKSYAAAVRRNISDDRTYGYKHYKPSYELTEPKGTSHISVLDKDGNAVALTTTVNLYWGALVHDNRTGIVLNSEMDDFSIPTRSNAYDLRPSIYNYIKPYKRPLSSTSPTISVERDGLPGLIIGGSGGSKIVTSVFECIIKSYLWGFNLLDTVRSPRIHHQLIPEVAYVERGVSEEVKQGLVSRGHKVEEVEWIGSVVQAVRRVEDGTIVAVADWWRKRGKAAGY